jgi:apolipoprotein N-acyltransferase
MLFITSIIRQRVYSLKATFIYGFLWGFIVFSLHFIWLFMLLIKKSMAGVFLAGVLYAIVVVYFTLLTAAWYTIIVFSSKKSILLSCLAIIFYGNFILNHSFFFIQKGLGYPFISPAIPLAQYKSFLLVVRFVYSSVFGFETRNLSDNDFNIIYYKNLTSYKNPVAACFEAICAANRKFSYLRTSYIVFPESFYQFSLNKDTTSLQLFKSVLFNKNINCFMGSHYEKDDKLYQAVYWINHEGIQSIHKKHHCVPFVEYIPHRIFKSFKFLFLQDRKEFSFDNNSEKGSFFSLDDKNIILPQICSEFFLSKTIIKISSIVRSHYNRNIVIFLFVNDSWFVDYFRKILHNIARLTSTKVSLPIWYIGHYNSIKIWYKDV